MAPEVLVHEHSSISRAVKDKLIAVEGRGEDEAIFMIIMRQECNIGLICTVVHRPLYYDIATIATFLKH